MMRILFSSPSELLTTLLPKKSILPAIAMGTLEAARSKPMVHRTGASIVDSAVRSTESLKIPFRLLSVKPNLFGFCSILSFSFISFASPAKA